MSKNEKSDRYRPSGLSNIDTEGLPTIEAQAVASPALQSPSGINININLNDRSHGGGANASVDGRSQEVNTDHRGRAVPQGNQDGGGPIVEVARSPSHKKRRGNKSMLKDGEAPTHEYMAKGGFDQKAAKQYLTDQGWPVGLQEAMIKSCLKMPVRFFICDDSGSMLTNDGHRIVGCKNKTKLITCTRWSEVCASLMFHAEFSEAARAPSEFRLLNNAEPVLVGKGDDEGAGFELIKEILEDSPGGQTPICAQVNEVVAKIKAMEDSLRAQNQRAAVVICTDGISTDGNVADALKPLEDLPVWVVVRLCTDDEELIDYWNNIDEDLELEMDVLDDIEGEAKEIRAVNPWLHYGEPLHRLREFGAAIKEMDLIDEAPLSSEQMSAIVVHLTGSGNVRDW